MYVLMNDQKNGPHEGQYVDESMEGYTTNLHLPPVMIPATKPVERLRLMGTMKRPSR